MTAAPCQPAAVSGLRANIGQLTVYATSGRSDWVSSEMEESASGGRMSTSALECRCSAMEALGLSSSRFSVDRMRT